MPEIRMMYISGLSYAWERIMYEIYSTYFIE